MLLIYSYVLYYVMVAFGITFGYHRSFAHKRYRPNKIVKSLMLYVGLLCGGQSVLRWSAVHRMHHKYVDTKKDPHSPIHQPWWKIVFSTWVIDTNPMVMCKDLIKDPIIMHFHENGWKYLFLTYFFSYLIHWKLLVSLLLVFVFSYIGFGVLNYFGHNENGAVNSRWINLFAPFEGNHEDHHDYDNQSVTGNGLHRSYDVNHRQLYE